MMISSSVAFGRGMDPTLTGVADFAAAFFVTSGSIAWTELEGAADADGSGGGTTNPACVVAVVTGSVVVGEVAPAGSSLVKPSSAPRDRITPTNVATAATAMPAPTNHTARRLRRPSSSGGPSKAAFDVEASPVTVD